MQTICFTKTIPLQWFQTDFAKVNRTKYRQRTKSRHCRSRKYNQSSNNSISQIYYVRYQKLIIFFSTSATETPIPKANPKATHSASFIKNHERFQCLGFSPVQIRGHAQNFNYTQEPTRKSLKEFQEYIKDKAMAITSTDPLLGFLGLVINSSSYSILSDNQTSFIPPTNPRKAPPDDSGLTAPQITEGICRYNRLREKNRTLSEFQIILVSIITNNCPEKYFSTLKYPITKFCHCTPIQLLKHLWDEYSKITPQDLTNNYTHMTTIGILLLQQKKFFSSFVIPKSLQTTARKKTLTLSFVTSATTTSTTPVF